MEWDGSERRKNERFCDGHIDFSNSLCRIEERLINVDKRINGSIGDVEKHIEQGTKWRLAIIIAVIGLIGMYTTRVENWARVNKQQEVNCNRLDKLEDNIELR